MAASDATVDVVELMSEHLGVHPANGERLLERGWVTLDGARMLPSERYDAENGQYLEVLGRQLRIEVAPRRLPPQGELF